MINNTNSLQNIPDLSNLFAESTKSKLRLGKFGDAMSYVKAHPKLATGTALNAAGNLAGLTDNDKIVGQLVGGIGGAVLPGVLGMGLGPLGIANTAMLGGNLGALFDKLRAKREQEAATQLPAEYTTY